MTEAERILGEYERREQRLSPSFYSLSNPTNLFAYQQKNRTLLRLYEEEGLHPLEGKVILDIGCGNGQQLLDLISWGARPCDLAGIDLIGRRVALAQTRLGTGNENSNRRPDLRVGDASHLPWGDNTFDVVHQNTVFTSILDPGTKKQVAKEILRVLKPGGALIWYDFHVNNPQNRNVRAIGAAEIRSLFDGCRIRLKRITLAPPIARRLVPISWVGALLLEHVFVLNTHYLGVVRK